MTDLLSLSARQCADLFARKAASPVDLLEAVLKRLEAVEPQINAFALVDRAGARQAAEESAARHARGAAIGPADGLIGTIKDNVLVKGLPNRRGTRTSVDTPAVEDSPATARLKEAGCVILGKTTLPEIGWKGLGDSPLYGVTRNPWKTGHTTGGSSAGAAAAAALGLGHFHLGTDGLGSIRIPAAFTGVFGLKPSFGRVPAYPLSTMAVLAHLGPLTRRVEDGAFMLSLIGRPDSRDNTAWNTPCPDYTDGLDKGVRGLRIAWSPRMGYVDCVDPDVAAATEKAAKVFAELGATVEEVDPPIADPRGISDILWHTGAAVAMKHVGVSDEPLLDPGLLAEVKSGRTLTAVQYLDAFLARGKLAHEMAVFHETYDLLLTPQMPTGAIPTGADVPPGSAFKHWVEWSPFTYPFNVTQQPAASVPCGLTRDGLPIGLQIVGAMREDALVLQAARAFEQARPFAMIDAPRA
ncbi:MAG: amidase [Methylobacteriaceae bacterium]|nr:amidase [Rhodoblastus sp.]MCC0006285.1 amidase [Methylobacteriaceae bacterium]